MQAAIDRVMQTYGLMANLTPGQEAEARQKVSNFLKERSETSTTWRSKASSIYLAALESHDDGQLTSGPRPIVAVDHRAS